MVAKKRTLDDSASSQINKKVKTDVKRVEKPAQSSLLTEEVDFPRGGGTTFTPLEVKAIRAEAVKEANAELFDDANKPAAKKRKRKTDKDDSNTEKQEKKDKIRIEQMNYKRLSVGMKIFGQIATVLPLALIVSLPNQLFAHVPITNISSQFTEKLEKLEAGSDIEREEDELSDNEEDRLPELAEMFYPGQYVRAVISAVHPAGASDTSGIGRARDEVSKASKRVELTLVPERVNAGVQKTDLKEGFTLTAAIKSQEDHGYILDLGVPEISGFLSSKDAEAYRQNSPSKLAVGQIVDVVVSKLSSNGRTCNVTVDKARFASSSLSEISSITSVLPGSLVQGLITAIVPGGLILQVLGFFDGTIELLQLDRDISTYKVGKKVKARVLYEYSSSPPKLSLSLAKHVVQLTDRFAEVMESGDSVAQNYPIGLVLEGVKVIRTDPERGLIVEVAPGIHGFVHISHTSDDHVPSLSPTGPWKPGTIHPARVTGAFMFDGLLQLSMKPSIIQQKYLQVQDVEVGELVKGTIKKLGDSCLFVSLSGGVDGVVWPNHYADIALKHPGKRFKEGAPIKCKVLSVDPERKRISLTAKKTLVDSTLPTLKSLEDVKVGVVTHAVVFKVFEKHLLVEFFNNMKAFVPAKEVSDTPKSRLAEAFPVGKVVRVRITGREDDRIVASVRQASSAFDVADINSVEIGNSVQGQLTEIHNDNLVLILQPSKVKALLSIKNLANYRSLQVAQLKATLKTGEILEDLVVVTRSPEKGIVIVANKPKPKDAALPKSSNITMETLTIGQLVGGRVLRHTRHGALIKITSSISGSLHLTDLSDDFDKHAALPLVDTVIKAAVVDIDQAKRQVILSTRQSRLRPDNHGQVVDREVQEFSELQVGQTIRGFVKSIAEHGLFVTVGRDLDARVQIKELFDEYVKEWQPRFKAGQVVKGRILSLDADNKKIEMTFKSGDLSQRSKSSKVALSDLKEGQKIEGTVARVEDYGLFIQIKNSKLNGLCHKSELSDNKDADVSVALQNFKQGDKVKAIIIKIENRRISLSLKPSHFTKEELEGSDEEDAEDEEAGEEGSDDEGDEVEGEGELSEDGSEMDEDDVEAPSDDESEHSMDVDVDQSQIEYQPAKASTSRPSISSQVPTLSLSGGFQWTADATHHEDDEVSASSDDEDREAGQPSRKKRKKKEIQYDLTADMHTRAPESNADFERLLLGSPNSSYLWIQYMSFQLPLSEIDKAREIARRGIQTISFREEKERLNVWIALLNLENVYGTDESLDAVFKEAARANDSKTIHLRLASILEQSDKFERAEEQFKKTCKKFGHSSKVWTLFAEYYLKRGQVEEARKLVPRSLQSLEKRKHLKTICKFAQLEYKFGDPERGKTLFEGILDSHPKRWDMWSIYMDMDASQGNIQGIRNLFERVFTHKMTSHKAKSFFKKWLDLEKRIGDGEGEDTVKQKAVEWTLKASNSS